MTMQEVHTRALEFVKRLVLGNGHQPDGLVERAGQKAHLRCGNRPLRTPRGVLCQRDSALQERGCSGHNAPSLGAASGSLKLSGDVLVGPSCGAGAVPGSSVRVGFDIGGIGERAVDTVAVVRGPRPVRGGADERVCELHALSDDEQPGVQRGICHRHVDLEGLGGALQQDRVADRLGGRAEEEELCVRGQPPEAPYVAVLYLPGYRGPLGQPEPAS
jgi:hypothetical protein